MLKRIILLGKLNGNLEAIEALTNFQKSQNQIGGSGQTEHFLEITDFRRYLQQADDPRITCLVTEISLGDKAIASVVQTIRNSRLAAIPLIIFVPKMSDDRIAAMYKAGANLVLEMPYSLDRITAAFQSAELQKTNVKAVNAS